LSAVTLSYLLVQPLAGYLADTFNTRITVLAGLVVAALATIAVVFSSGPLLIAIAVIAGLGIGTVWTNTDALVGQFASESQLGASMGAAQSFKELGDMVGPLSVGLLTQFFGVRAGFVTCGVLALLLLIPLAIAQKTTMSPAPR
jgi:MFS family permease